jgi:hypothetical protein
MGTPRRNVSVVIGGREERGGLISVFAFRIKTDFPAREARVKG